MFHSDLYSLDLNPAWFPYNPVHKELVIVIRILRQENPFHDQDCVSGKALALFVSKMYLLERNKKEKLPENYIKSKWNME